MFHLIAGERVVVPGFDVDAIVPRARDELKLRPLLETARSAEATIEESLGAAESALAILGIDSAGERWTCSGVFRVLDAAIGAMYPAEPDLKNLPSPSPCAAANTGTSAETIAPTDAA
jgi:hypothetical protein